MCGKTMLTSSLLALIARHQATGDTQKGQFNCQQTRAQAPQVSRTQTQHNTAQHDTTRHNTTQPIQIAPGGCPAPVPDAEEETELLPESVLHDLDPSTSTEGERGVATWGRYVQSFTLYVL